MDKELPESQLPSWLSKAYVRVTPSYLPGYKGCRGSIMHRSTIGIPEIVERIAAQGGTFSKETLATSFEVIKNEIYRAVEDGFNVDFGLGRTDINVNGSFEHENEPYDRRKHTLIANLLPSPQLKQRVGRIPFENITGGTFANAPTPHYVSLRIEPRTPDSTEPYNQLPAGRHPFISIYGRRLTLMGDLPEVGVRLRCVATGEEYFFPPNEMSVNSLNRLCFLTGFDFTPGEWEATIASQFNTTYRPYKKARYGYLTFTVV